jgi:FixJ family two-component response regulator
MTSISPVIHVVDDDPMFRDGIARLRQAGGYRVVTYESGHQLLAKLSSREPGCILLDMRMPGLDGLELQARLNEIASVLPIVFLTGQGSVPTSVRAMKGGAEDVLTKPVSKNTLFETIERALARYRDRREQRDLLDALQARVNALTSREREVFSLMVRGQLTKQIAFNIGASERTVKAHRHSIMEKLAAHSIAEAVSIAERVGMLAAPGTRS